MTSTSAAREKFTAERLIQVFYRPLGESNDETGDLEAMLHALESESDAVIFNDQTLRNLETSRKLVPYLSSILAASTSNLSSDKSSTRRGFCFLKAIYFLKGGRLSQNDSREMFDRLLANVRLLKENQAINCIDKVLDEFRPADQNSLSGHGIALELLWQLAAIAGPSRKPYIIQKLHDLDWPKAAVVMLSATLVELCENEAECEGCILKIQEHLAWNKTTLNRAAEGSSTHAAAVATSSSVAVDVEELPALLYQVTNLTKKCDNSAVVRNLVVETVTDALDSLLWASFRAGENASVRNRIDTVLATTVHHLSLLVNKDQAIAAEVVSLVKTRRLLAKRQQQQQTPQTQAGQTSSTSATVSASAVTAAVSVSGGGSSGGTDGSSVVSPAKILLCMLAAKAPRQEVKIITALCEAVGETHLIQEKVSSSLWHATDTWKVVLELRPGQMQAAFEVLFAGSLLVEAVAAQLVALALALMEMQRSTPKSSWNSISSISLHCVSRPHSFSTITTAGDGSDHTGTTTATTSPAACVSADALGAWLLTRLFCVCEHTREQIARDLVTRLLISSISSSSSTSSSAGRAFSSSSGAGGGGGGGGGGFGGQSSSSSAAATTAMQAANACVSVLQNLMIECPHGLMGVSRELTEALSSLPELHPDTAGRLVYVIAPLFSSCAALGDRCALSLRKASFSKDGVCRQAAVSALIALLRSQLTLATTRHISAQLSSSSYSSSSSSSAAGGLVQAMSSVPTMAGINALDGVDLGEALRRVSPTGLSLDEITSLLRRLLQNQASVRGTLYRQLYCLQKEFSAVRPLAFRLLLTHMQSLMIDGIDDGYGAAGGANHRGGGNRGVSYSSLLGGGGAGSSSSSSVRLDVDACIDSACVPQECIGELLLTLLAMIQDADAQQQQRHQQQQAEGLQQRGSNSSYNRYSTGDGVTDAENASMSQFIDGDITSSNFNTASNNNRSSSSSSSSGRPIPQTTASSSTSSTTLQVSASSRGASAVSGGGVPSRTSSCPEVDDARSFLWSLAKSFAEKPLKDFGIRDLTGTSAGIREQARMALLREACHAAAVCVTGLLRRVPGVNTEVVLVDRTSDVASGLKILKCLMQRIEELSMLLASLAAARKKKEATTAAAAKGGKERDKKKPRHAGGAQQVDDDHEDSDQEEGVGEQSGAALIVRRGGADGCSSSSSSYVVSSNQDSVSTLHLLRSELEFSSLMLSLILQQHDHDEDGDDDPDEQAAAQQLSQFTSDSLKNNALAQYTGSTGFDNVDYVHVYSLDCSMRTIEKLMAHYSASATSVPSSSGRGSRNAGDDEERGDENGDVPIVDTLFVLLRDMMRQRSVEGEVAVQGSGGGVGGKRKPGGAAAGAALGAPSTFSPKQLVFRSILGCIRLEIARTYTFLRRRQQQSSNSTDVTGGASARSTSAPPPPVLATTARAAVNSAASGNADLTVFSRVSSLIYSSFSRAKLIGASASDDTATGNTGTGTAATGTALTATATATGGGASNEMANKILQLVKSFTRLFLNMHKSDSGRDVCPIIVTILGEIASVLPASFRSRVGDTVLKQCENKLVSPSQHLSQTLTQFVILQCPRSVEDRLKRTTDVAALIAKCAEDAVQLAKQRAERGDDDDDEDEEDDDGEDDDNEEEGGGGRKRGRNKRQKGGRKKKGGGALPGETFTLVCSTSLVPTVVCLVGILDKAVTETETLLKLREKRGSNLDAKAVRSSGTGAAAAASAAQEMFDDEDDRLFDPEAGGVSASVLRARARHALAGVDNKVYLCLQKLFESAVGLLHTSVADAAEKVIGLFIKLFKLQVRVTKGLVNQKTLSLPPSYRTLSEFIANSVSPEIEDFILAIHNSEGKGKALVKINRQAKVVPDLIFIMEQLDVQLIKLSGIVRLIDKKSVTKLIKRTAARDVKIVVPGDSKNKHKQHANNGNQQNQKNHRNPPSAGRGHSGGAASAATTAAAAGHKKRDREEEEEEEE